MRVNIGLFQFSDMIMGSGSWETRNLDVIGESLRILVKSLQMWLQAIRVSTGGDLVCFATIAEKVSGRFGYRETNSDTKRGGSSGLPRRAGHDHRFSA
jgi:hypothetical protein